MKDDVTSKGRGGCWTWVSTIVSYPSLGLLRSFWHVESLDRATYIFPVSGSSLYNCWKNGVNISFDIHLVISDRRIDLRRIGISAEFREDRRWRRWWWRCGPPGRRAAPCSVRRCDPPSRPDTGSWFLRRRNWSTIDWGRRLLLMGGLPSLPKEHRLKRSPKPKP